MQIILLEENRFDEYAINHPNYNIYQSSNYGRLMTKKGYNAYYLRLVDDSNKILAATLMIVKNDKEATKRKMGYAPRGFLIDWNDENLVKDFTEKIKEFLSNRGFTYLKLDPQVIYKSYDNKGNEKSNLNQNNYFVSQLQNFGYIHMGFNKGKETNKSRYNSIIKLSENPVYTYNELSKEARGKIQEASKNGCKVYKGTNNDIGLLSELINDISKEDMLDYYQFFNSNNTFEIYFTKLEPVSFVNSSKKMFEEEEYKNAELTRAMQDFNVPNKEEIVNQKMESDEKLASYKKNMMNAIALFQKFPSGIVISALIAIKNKQNALFLSEGSLNDYKHLYPDYLLKWQVAQEYSNQGLKIVDCNEIDSNLTSNSYIEKKEMATELVEYVGEFDLVINKRGYYTGSKLNPIISWLNTPI